MTQTMPNEDDIIAAAELSLGLLPSTERLALTMRVAHDPAFAAIKAGWDDQLSHMADGREEQPPTRIWEGIDVALRAERSMRSAGKRPWQISTALAAAAALAFAVVAFERPSPSSHPGVQQATAHARPLVAILSGKSDAASVTVGINPADGTMLLAANGLSTDGHAAELWVVPASAKPVSLGLVPLPHPTWRSFKPIAAPMLQPGATLAISLEPIGGSPTGQPTGPIILTGTIRGG
ncbi:anti-sigma factor [Sphingomonas nostoxanthinifaciens]|uniref:anti-sigma factor n=1 Tax=Sphingomonas nostoxanthinifaciens TaxID=2872652 RepID=UPI001CC21E66|nr:anti-sigma factor [Sphingomonas nostoxanthinifaciens]UAK23175.1 anti-sigma factor [Sphingomonas nostoxanthinifaciens]